MDIVYGNSEKIDFDSSLIKVKKVDKLERKMFDSMRDQVVFVSEYTEKVDLFSTSHKEFIPYRNLPENLSDRGRLFTYFELDIYPFFEKVKEVIAEQRKGVLRFRRNVPIGNTKAIIVEDLFVIAKLLGKPEHVKVIHSKRKVDPQHVILTVNFRQGSMAHLEYTFMDREGLEFEWSGIKKIIEFNSEDLCQVKSNQNPYMPFTYSIDSILKAGHEVSADLRTQLEKWKDLVKGEEE